jgi:hypothetical protein
MACGCSGQRRHNNVIPAAKTVKVRYLGDLEEPTDFVGVATKNVYVFGGKVNLGDVDVRDLTIGRSTRPGLFELTDGKGQKLFEKHTPLKEEAKAKAREAREAAEALAIPDDGEAHE